MIKLSKKGIPLSTELTVDRVISAFYHHFPEDFRYDGEQHPGWEFVYVESGRAKAQADDQVYILKSGEMVCHKPMEFHRVRPYHGSASLIIICFECSAEPMRLFNNKILSLTPRQKQYLNDIVLSAEKLLLPKDPLEIVRDGAMDRAPDATAAQEQTVKNTSELLILSLMDAQSTARSQRVELYEQYLHRRHLTADVIRYLRENMTRPVRLSDIEEHFPYSLSSIRRIFKKETGCGIMEYLNDMRIVRAKELLADPHFSVESIASAVGFANTYYFSNAFKKSTGKSPRLYRKELPPKSLSKEMPVDSSR